MNKNASAYLGVLTRFSGIPLSFCIFAVFSFPYRSLSATIAPFRGESFPLSGSLFFREEPYFYEGGATMLQPGITQEITFSVSNELTAKTVGSGTLDVLATPVMIARMEQAAWMTVAPHLSPEESTVGTRMDAKHLSPTPVGMDVTCRAELTQVEGRRLVFHVTAWDAQGPIGEGTHERAIIQAPRFLEKAQKKLQETQ